MKLKLLGASALTLAFAFAGAPAASAHTAIGPNTSFYLETYSESTPGAPPLCVSSKVEHTDQVWLTTDTASCAVMEEINPAAAAGNTWLEMEITNDSNCFNWVPEGTTGPVESDSCVKGDDNELWYSKYPSDTNTAFENLEGNSSTGDETYLQPTEIGTTWFLIASTTPFAGWDVVST
jgi:hypothetical protein